MVTTNPARKETEDETKEERSEAKLAPMLEDGPLVLLQLNCRSIYVQ